MKHRLNTLIPLSLLLTACSASGGLNLPIGNPVTVKSTSISSCAQEVAEVRLSSLQRSATFNTELVAPGSFKHQYRVIVVDTTAFTSAGRLKISGTVGSGTSAASFALLEGSPAYPCLGFGDASLQSAANIRPNGTFELNQSFSSGQVYRLTLEGNWDSPENSSNTVALNFSVE